MKTPSFRQRTPILVILVVLAGGCEPAAKIGHERVPKIKDRTLAAILPRGEQAWFFKLTGPESQVGDVREPFESLVSSVTFSDKSGEPTWTLPADWREETNVAGRFATLRLGQTPGALELSVTQLPLRGDDVAGYELSNVNRWRDQLQLLPISREDLEQQVQRLRIDDTAALLVDFTGVAAPAAPRPTFTSNDGTGQEAMRRGSAPDRTTGAAKSPLSFDVPEGWQASRMGSLRKAAFNVVDEDQSVEITVIDLAKAGGALLPNVNRWREQVGLGRIDQATLEQTAEELTVDDVSGTYVELVGPSEASPSKAILGVIAMRDELAWFFKLTGDAELALREKNRFREFVESVKFVD